jgi:hypothetical protein
MGYALCRRPPTIAHCARIADSWDCCKRILAFLVPKLVIWHAWWLHFGVLGSKRKDTLRSRLRFLLISARFRDPTF